MADTSTDRAVQNADKAEAFTNRMNEVVKGGFISLGLALGAKLELFKKMGEINKPASSQEIADATDCKERYIREWLYFMAASDVVEMSESGQELFFLPPDHRPGVGCGNAENMVDICWTLPLIGITFVQLLDIFRKVGSLGIRPEDGYVLLEQWGQCDRKFGQAMSDLVANVPFLENALNNGGEFLDIGGGPGNMALTFAQKFPNAMCHSCDISIPDKESGIAKAKALEITNVIFDIEDAGALPDAWSDKFAYAIMFDVLHDLPFPRKAAANAFKVLKPGCYLSVIDAIIDSDPRLATKQQNAVVFYGWSIFHCLGRSLAVEGSEGLGAAAGIQKLTSILEEAGFKVERAPDVNDMYSYCHLLCQKPFA